MYHNKLVHMDFHINYSDHGFLIRLSIKRTVNSSIYRKGTKVLLILEQRGFGSPKWNQNA